MCTLVARQALQRRSSAVAALGNTALHLNNTLLQWPFTLQALFQAPGFFSGAAAAPLTIVANCARQCTLSLQRRYGA